MIGDLCACDGVILNRSFLAEILQELTSSNMEATYRWIAYTTNVRVVVIRTTQKKHFGYHEYFIHTWSIILHHLHDVINGKNIRQVVE